MIEMEFSSKATVKQMHRPRPRMGGARWDDLNDCRPVGQDAKVAIGFGGSGSIKKFGEGPIANPIALRRASYLFTTKPSDLPSLPSVPSATAHTSPALFFQDADREGSGSNLGRRSVQSAHRTHGRLFPLQLHLPTSVFSFYLHGTHRLIAATKSRNSSRRDTNTSTTITTHRNRIHLSHCTVGPPRFLPSCTILDSLCSTDFLHIHHPSFSPHLSCPMCY